MTFCYWHFIIQGRKVSGEFIHNGNSCCEMCLEVVDYKERKRKLEQTLQPHTNKPFKVIRK